MATKRWRAATQSRTGERSCCNQKARKYFSESWICTRSNRKANRMKKIFTLAVLTMLAAVAQADDLTFKVGETSFTRPAKWEWVPVASAMRKAQLEITDDNTKTNAEVVFFQFDPGPMGGGKGNVARAVRPDAP